MKINNSKEKDLEKYNENKIDWEELMPKTPKYYKITPVQFIFIFIIILAGIYFVQAAILGLWDGGTQ